MRLVAAVAVKKLVREIFDISVALLNLVVILTHTYRSFPKAAQSVPSRRD